MSISGQGRVAGLLRRRLSRFLRNQQGSLLVEALVALSVFGVLGSAVLGGVQVSLMSKRTYEVRATAENVARNQMEYVFEQTYAPPSSAYLTVTPPAPYTVTVEALVYDATSADIETVRVTVFREGAQVRVLETLRSNW